MKITGLIPPPQAHEAFRRNCERFVPTSSGCYALSTYDKTIVYIGLTNNLRRRFNEHLDNPTKTGQTASGRAVFFFWIEVSDTGKVERTWLNSHLISEGRLPELNRINSPVNT